MCMWAAGGLRPSFYACSSSRIDISSCIVRPTEARWGGNGHVYKTYGGWGSLRVGSSFSMTGHTSTVNSATPPHRIEQCGSLPALPTMLPHRTERGGSLPAPPGPRPILSHDPLPAPPKPHRRASIRRGAEQGGSLLEARLALQTRRGRPIHRPRHHPVLAQSQPHRPRTTTRTTPSLPRLGPLNDDPMRHEPSRNADADADAGRSTGKGRVNVDTDREGWTEWGYLVRTANEIQRACVINGQSSQSERCVHVTCL